MNKIYSLQIELAMKWNGAEKNDIMQLSEYSMTKK